MPATALAGGRRVTLPQYVRELATVMQEMCEAGLITTDVAPEASDLLPRVIELTHYAEEGSIARCAQNLDWAAKLMVLLELAEQPGVRLGDAQTRLCDHDFANTDPTRGDFWRLWREGRVDPLIDRAAVDACLADGPIANRGYGRGRLIQSFSDSITDIDWSYVELRRDDDRWSPRLRIDMPNPASLARERIDPILARAGDVAQLEALLDQQEQVPTSQADPIRDIQSQLATPPPSGTSLDNSHVNPQQIEEST